MNLLNKTSIKFVIGFLIIIFFSIIGLAITKAVDDRQAEKTSGNKIRVAQ